MIMFLLRISQDVVWKPGFLEMSTDWTSLRAGLARAVGCWHWTGDAQTLLQNELQGSSQVL
jgi:hypothetical protein